MNKTLINPLNLLHEIIPVFTTMHCTLPVLNNKKVQGKKNYIYIYRNLERERREAREMDGYMGEFFFYLNLRDKVLISLLFCPCFYSQRCTTESVS